MSYILDAIQKAEQERQQHQVAPVYRLQNSQHGENLRAARRQRYLMLGVGAVLAANLAAWYWQTNPVAASQSQAPIAQASQAQNIESPAPVASVSTAEFSAEPPVQAANSRVVSRVKLWQAGADAQTAIASLEFSFHVYSDHQEQRMIIINGSRMAEGDRISQELSLVEITETGVLLDYRGRYVDVDVLEQW